MPAATTKSDLIAVTDRDYAKLQALLDRVPPESRLIADPEADGTTLRDIVGHRAHWITLFLGWYHAGQSGDPVALPAPGYKWNELRHFNADLRATQAGQNWEEARAALHDNHLLLMQFIEGLDQYALYQAPMAGGGNHWTTGRWAEAAGASHYRSAAKYIRARLRALSKKETV